MKNLNKVLCHSKIMIFITFLMNKATQAKRVNKVKREINKHIKLQVKIFLYKTNHHHQILLLVR